MSSCLQDGSPELVVVAKWLQISCGRWNGLSLYERVGSLEVIKRNCGKDGLLQGEGSKIEVCWGLADAEEESGENRDESVRLGVKALILRESMGDEVERFGIVAEIPGSKEDGRLED